MKHHCLAAAIGFLLAFSTAPAFAQSSGPPAGYKLDDEYTTKSPDGATTIEQYAKTDNDDNYTWQFWARTKDTFVLLKPEQPDYAADFRFTKDSQWLVRLQKTGSGEGDLYLYRLGPQGFAAATTKSFSDLAWAFFKGRPEWRKITKPDFHIYAGLMKGIADNYRSLGVNWPDNRYIVVGLSGDVISHHHQISPVDGWWCRYDLQTGKFDVPPEFAANNAKAIVPK